MGKTSKTILKVKLKDPQKAIWFSRTSLHLSRTKLSQGMKGRVTVALTLWTSCLFQKVAFPDFSPPLTCTAFANSFSNQGHNQSPPISSQIVSGTKFPGKKLTYDLWQDPTCLENLESRLDSTPIVCLPPWPLQQAFGSHWCSSAFWGRNLEHREVKQSTKFAVIQGRG